MPSKKRKKPTVDAVVARKKHKSDKQVNPFEVRVNRKKHDILGQKSKCDKGLPGVSRSKAIQKRKKTLLQEYKLRNKTNQFVDRRFGENEEDMSVEDKLMKRLIMERKRKHERSSVFNLEDDEEGLTHYGRSLGEMEKFDEVKISDDEEEEDIGETHFGGFLKKKRPKHDDEQLSENEEQPKTRKQILEEIVAKSKAKKYERQSERHEVEDLLHQVDADWKDVHTYLVEAKKVKPSKGSDDYDKIVRELVFERRGQPTDRMKTEEEIEKEEKERLERLEADRVRRMKGLPLVTKDEHVSADYIHQGAGPKKEVRFTLTYQDGKIVLPEGVDMEDVELRTNRKEDDSVDSDDVGSDGVESEDLESDSVEGEVTVSDDDDDDDDLVSEDEEDDGVESEDVEDDGVESEDVEDNGVESEDVEDDGVESEDEESDVKGDDVVLKSASSLFKLSQVNSAHTAKVFNELLMRKHSAWFSSEKSCEYPPLSDLLLFNIIGVVFPTSDYQHPVVTPAMLMMAHLLLKCKVKSVHHLLCGLYVCEILTEYVSQSKRFIPEVVNFLTSALGMFGKRSKCVLYPPFSSKGSLRSELAKCDRSKSLDCECTLSVALLISRSAQQCQVSRYQVFKITLKLIVVLLELYKDLPSFPEVFSSVRINLQCIDSANWPPDIQESLTKTSEIITTKAARPRSYLQLLKQKPKSIKFYEPKFDVVYEIGRKKARSKAAGEHQKLKHKVKKETKGAIREIRKDARFLAKEKLKDTLQRDAERERKTKKILHDLQTMQHEAKMERTKKR